MTEHDPDSSAWLRSHRLARDLVRSAESDTPDSGFEARVLGRLRTDGSDAAQHSGAGPVDAIDDVSVDLRPGPTQIRPRHAASAVAALAAAAALGVWMTRGASSEQRAVVTEPPDRSSSSDGIPTASTSCERSVRADPGVTPIDDFEDGNARMLVHAGRFGTWSYVTLDEPGSPVPRPLVPEPLGRLPGNRRALHARDTERHDWRAVWATFGPSCYDASAFVGVRFAGKGPAKLALEVATVDVVERRYGGACETNCNHRYRRSIALTGDFASYEVLFDELAQAPDTPESARRALDPRWLIALAFVVEPGSDSFDFWIDDVEWMDRR